MANKASAKSSHDVPPERSYAHTSSRDLLKNYDKSPLSSPHASPPQTPGLPRSNSSTSVVSTASAPPALSERRLSEPTFPSRGDLSRKSNGSNSPSSSQMPKRSGLKGIFMKKTAEEKQAEKMRRKWQYEKEKIEYQKFMLESKRSSIAKANKTANKLLEPQNQDVANRKPKPNVKTAGITEYTASAHTSAAEQEARYPHSGPPTLRIDHDRDDAELSRIESQDQPDDEVDQWQQKRREWNESHEDDLGDILEIRSRQGSRVNSPWASPMGSREPSPSRLGVARPGLGSKRNSYQGAYHRDPTTGRWTKKATPPQRVSPGHMTPVYPKSEGVDADILAKSLMERLHTSA